MFLTAWIHVQFLVREATQAGFPQFHRGQNPLTEASWTLGNVSTFSTQLCQAFLHCHPPVIHNFLCTQNLLQAGLHTRLLGHIHGRAKVPKGPLIAPSLQNQKLLTLQGTLILFHIHYACSESIDIHQDLVIWCLHKIHTERIVKMKMNQSSAYYTP